MESAAGCGEKWRASFTKYDLNSRSWKTHQCSLLEDLESFSETWPQWGLMRDGECWEQRTLEQTIRGTESGLSLNIGTPTASMSIRSKKFAEGRLPTPAEFVEKWPTPRSCSAMAATITPESAWNEKRNPNLETIVGQRMWATPTSRDWRGHTITPNFPNGFNKNLVNDVKKFPTPQASDNRDRGNMSNPSIQRRVAKGKQIMLSQSVDPNSGQLNPTWVEWLMGWPLGWTDLKPLEMDKSPCVQRPHGEFLEESNG